jgi:hypothetical protein
LVITWSANNDSFVLSGGDSREYWLEYWLDTIAIILLWIIDIIKKRKGKIEIEKGNKLSEKTVCF